MERCSGSVKSKAILNLFGEGLIGRRNELEGASCGIGGLGVITSLGEGGGLSVPDGRIQWREMGRRRGKADGFGGIAEARVRRSGEEPGKLLEGRDVVGRQVQQDAEFFDGFIEVMLLGEGVREAGMGKSEIRIETDEAANLWHGFVRLAGVQISQTKVEIEFVAFDGGIRGSTEVGDSFSPFACWLKNQPRLFSASGLSGLIFSERRSCSMASLIFPGRTKLPPDCSERRRCLW